MISKVAKILFSIILLCLFSIAYAQSGFKYQPIAMVNDQPITPIDVEKRVRFLRIINNIPETVKVSTQDKDRILNDLIEEVIKSLETKRFEVKANEDRLESAFKAAAVNIGMQDSEFEIVLNANGLNREYFNRVTANNIAWNNLVNGRYGKDISVSTYEIAQIIEANAATDGISATFNQIKIPFDGSTEQYQEVQTILAQTSERLNNGETFQEISNSFIESELLKVSALSDLPPNISKILLTLRPNEISQPVKVDDYLILLQLVDRVKGDTSIINQRMKIKTGRLEFDSDMSQQEKSTYIDELNEQENLCDDYDDFIDDVLVFENTTISELPEELRLVAKEAPEKELRIVRQAQDSYYVLTVCKVKKTDYYNDVPPEVRSRVRNQIFGRKVDLKAKEYYRELKKDAVILILE